MRSKDWTEAVHNAELGSIWNLGETASLLMPQNPEFLDFQVRLWEVVRILADVEKRSQCDIYADILLLEIQQKIESKLRNAMPALHQAGGEKEKIYLNGVIDLGNDLLKNYFFAEKIY